MPKDLKFPFDFDGTGDASVVTGEDFYYQHAQILALIVAETRSGEPATRNDIVSLQSELGRTFAQSPYFDPPIDITAIEIDDEDNITMEVNVSNVSQFEVEV